MQWKRWNEAGAWRRSVRSLLPTAGAASALDMLRASVGVMLGVSLAALLVYWARTQGWAGGWALFAPLGATAVLIFAVHSGPLSQPWSCIVGNIVSALWAMLVVAWLPLHWAAPVAVAGAVACMLLTRSLHPPGGAMAFLLALEAGNGTIHTWEYAFVPLGAMTVMLVLTGMLYHRLWGRAYPLQKAAPTAGLPSQAPSLPVASLSTADLQGLLRRFDLGHNLTVNELSRLLQAAEAQAYQQRFSGMACGALMTGGPTTCAPDDRLAAVALKFQQQAVKSLPVVSSTGQLLGVVTRQALLDWLWKQVQGPEEGAAPQVAESTATMGVNSPMAAPGPVARTGTAAGVVTGGTAPAAPPATGWRAWKLLQRFRGAAARAAAPVAEAPMPLPRTAAELMHPMPVAVQESTPVSDLLAMQALHAVPSVAVLQGDRLVGMITRSDIVRLLLH